MREKSKKFSRMKTDLLNPKTYFMKNILLLLFCFGSLFSQANRDSLNSKNYKLNTENKLEKKLLWGFTFNNSWTTLSEADTVPVFTKPSLGAGLHIEYFPLKWIGVSLGIGHQQRGFGILTPDVDKSLGNADSTHRLRMRTNNISVPIMLTLRTPFNIFKDSKFSIMAGIVPTKVYSAKRIFHSIEDGFHDIQKADDLFYDGWDIPLRFSGGFDFNAADAALFRIHFMADFGSKNIFGNSSGYLGKNKLLGIELSILF
jgi:hypothetical protein